jgi:anti-sigma regulatory factor (Ser/Thr protein kinase)
MIDDESFPGTVGAIAAARRFARERLEDVPEDLAEFVVTMVSELTTNSVRHARTGFTVMIDRTSTELRVEVTDGGTGVPMVGSPGPSDPSGRGLLIVEQLSDAWGVRASTAVPGKTVWFTVALSATNGAPPPRGARERWVPGARAAKQHASSLDGTGPPGPAELRGHSASGRERPAPIAATRRVA